MSKACLCVPLAFVMVVIAAGHAEAGKNPPSVLVDLSPGTLGTDSQALGVNKNGDVVGSVLGLDGNQHAFVYTAGSLSVLGGGGSSSVAYGINDTGVVVGTMNGQAFSFTAGQATTLAALPGSSSATAVAINASGEIVGTAVTLSGTLAFTSAGSVVSPLGVLPGQTDSMALGVNSGGQTVGVSGGQAYFTTSSSPGNPVTFVNLGAYLFPGQTSMATGINDHTIVIGSVSDGTSSQGWWYSKGKVTMIPRLAATVDCTPRAINVNGEVVGTSGGRAFRYQSGLVQDLSTVIPAGSNFVSLDVATDVNDSGLIVGVGTTADGHQHGFTLQP